MAKDGDHRHTLDSSFGIERKAEAKSCLPVLLFTFSAQEKLLDNGGGWRFAAF